MIKSPPVISSKIELTITVSSTKDTTLLTPDAKIVPSGTGQCPPSSETSALASVVLPLLIEIGESCPSIILISGHSEKVPRLKLTIADIL